MKSGTISALSLYILFLLGACTTNEDSGKYYFKVYTDPAFEIFVSSAVETEQVRDTGYVASLVVVPQENGIDSLLENKTSVIFASRTLTKEEREYLKSIQKSPTSYEIAWDALAIIRHRDDPDTVVSIEQLKALAKDPKAKILIDQSNSANLSFLASKLGLSNNEANIYAAGSDSLVLATVKANKGITGVVSFAYLADKDDPEVVKRRSEIRLVSVSDGKKAVAPSLDALASDLYPLKRLVYMHTTESVNGLSAGLAGFMLGDRGKRLLLKMGILPYKMPGREVEIIKKDL